MIAASLAVVLHTLTLAQKIERLSRLSPVDAQAVELIVDDCLRRAWPNTQAEWIALDATRHSRH